MRTPFDESISSLDGQIEALGRRFLGFRVNGVNIANGKGKTYLTLKGVRRDLVVQRDAWIQSQKRAARAAAHDEQEDVR